MGSWIAHMSRGLCELMFKTKLLLAFCLLLLPFWESVIVLCFVVRYFISILVLQSSWWGRESWLLCLICLPGVSWWLSGSSLQCHGVVCSLWLWYFLIILTYYFLYLPLLAATLWVIFLWNYLNLNQWFRGISHFKKNLSTALMALSLLCNFGREHYEEYFCEIIMNLYQWFRSRCCL